MSIATRVSEAEFLRLAAADPQGFWELVDGVPRSKPPMSAEHNFLAFELGYTLRSQIDPSRYELRVNASFVRWTERNAFIPDVVILPREQVAPQKGTGALERYAEPLPLVVEIWSRSTGDYDISVKLAAYQARGDAEIWRLHPYERTLTRWVRQPDGAYAESVHADGIVELAALPGVAVDLDDLFAR
jgi:Uma2 family endonuclease